MQARRIDDTGLCQKLIGKKAILYFLVAGNVCTINSMKTWKEEMQDKVWD